MESRRRYIIAGAEEKEKESKRSRVRPWRITQDVPRACLDVVIAGVGYLL